MGHTIGSFSIILYICLLQLSVAEYVTTNNIPSQINNKTCFQYNFIKSENHLRAIVIAGISVTELLRVSKIQGKTNQNKYITAAIEIIINAAG